jgi:pimeloyl-ACP methyl ester carboxylesterase
MLMKTTIETRLIEANGLSFEVDTCGGGDRFALLLHGFPESSYSWRYQLPLLARLGYTAWAPNLRGYGGSSRPARVADYALPHLLADVAGLIDAAGARETLLVGHDWGGAIAWSFALAQQRPLDGLIVMNLPHPLRFIQGLKRWPQMKRSWYIYFFQLPLLPELLLGAGHARAIGRAIAGSAANREHLSREVLQVYRDQASQPGALRAMINYYRALVRFRGFEHVRAHLREPLATPTLMLWGEQDHALGKELTLGTDELVEDLTLRYLPAAAHWVQQEAPETVNAMIEAWLGGGPVPVV